VAVVGFRGGTVALTGTEEPAVLLAIQAQPVVVLALQGALLVGLCHDIQGGIFALVEADALEAVDMLVGASSA